ncbi:MAG: type II toxin-antitoxin system HicA family toxin, partial [Deltaproteobacteria bacterium]|nr:type II toxin-antitoxin system HicA family toxin [Deltaproteobacteria bacterium]MBW2011960.1 type II toxin-antitoxin system HicA family toxin [Deltaproteobacteria bacterium]
MTKTKKAIEKIKQNPQKVRFEKLKKILIEAGFSERQPRGGSSHFIFYHHALDRIVVLVKGSKVLPEYQVKDALRALALLEMQHGKK